MRSKLWGVCEHPIFNSVSRQILMIKEKVQSRTTLWCGQAVKNQTNGWNVLGLVTAVTTAPIGVTTAVTTSCYRVWSWSLELLFVFVVFFWTEWIPPGYNCVSNTSGYTIYTSRGILLWPEVCCFSCMDEQLIAWLFPLVCAERNGKLLQES